MTNETTALELINRVRKASYRLKAGTPGKEERSAIGWTCTNAADALEAAKARIAELEGALGPFADAADEADEYGFFDESAAPVTVEQCKVARAALEGKG